MTKYSKTKSDPICKWRNATPETVVELVSCLPKVPMSSVNFRNHMSNFYNGDFFRTPYQLAEQLGLYYEDKGQYIPRFTKDIDKLEAKDYLIKWMSKYYVPNPFTKRGFINIIPSILLVNSLVDYLKLYPQKPNLASASAALFGGEMGNIGCVKFILNQYSHVIDVDADYNMSITNTVSGPLNVPYSRDDKKAFFEQFK